MAGEHVAGSGGAAISTAIVRPTAVADSPAAIDGQIGALQAVSQMSVPEVLAKCWSRLRESRDSKSFMYRHDETHRDVYGVVLCALAFFPSQLHGQVPQAARSKSTPALTRSAPPPPQRCRHAQLACELRSCGVVRRLDTLLVWDVRAAVELGHLGGGRGEVSSAVL